MVAQHQAAAQGSQTIFVCSKSCAGKACHADTNTLISLCQKPAPLQPATLVSLGTFADFGGGKEALMSFVNRIIAAGNLPEQCKANTVNDKRASITTPSKTRTAFDFFPSPLNDELVAIAEPTTSNEPITIYIWAENMTDTELEMITSAMHAEAKAVTNTEDNAMEYEFAITSTNRPTCGASPSCSPTIRRTTSTRTFRRTCCRLPAVIAAPSAPGR